MRLLPSSSSWSCSAKCLNCKRAERTGGAIRALLQLAPKTAHRVCDNDKEIDIPLEDAHVGDRLRVRPGERVPLDGVVESGANSIDQSMLTGESIPIQKAEGARVVGGSVNGSGAFVMRADKIGKDTLLAPIVALVAAAQRSQAPIQRLAGSGGRSFVPGVAAVAALAFVGWLDVGVLPPAVRLTPLVAAVTVTDHRMPLCARVWQRRCRSWSRSEEKPTGGCAGQKRPPALSEWKKVDTLVIDKTGTLTEGQAASHNRAPALRESY